MTFSNVLLDDDVSSISPLNMDTVPISSIASKSNGDRTSSNESDVSIGSVITLASVSMCTEAGNEGEDSE